MYFGSNINDFYKVFRKVTGNKTFRLYDASNKEFDVLYYGNITYPQIATLLNENKIYKRGNLWNSQIVSKLLSETENFDVKYYENTNDDLNNMIYDE